MDQEKLSKFYAEAKFIVPLLILTYLAISMPNWLRDESNLLIGQESYYYMRLAGNPLSSYDELSYSGRFMLFNAYPLTLNIASNALGISLLDASKLLPVVFGLISVLLFYMILKKLELDSFTRMIAACILAISPAFIYTFSVSNTYFIPIAISLLMYLLVLNNRKIIAYSLLFITLFFGLVPFLILLALSIILEMKAKNYKGFYLLLFLGLLAVPIIKMGVPEFISFKTLQEGTNFRLQTFVAELGSEIGLSIFAIILALFGLKQLWQKKYEHIYVYLALIFFIIAIAFETKVILYLNFLIAILAAIGITRLIYQKWDSTMINIIIGIMMLIGLAFSTASNIGLLAQSMPDKQVIESFDFLKENSKENDVVASYYTKGYWINALAGRKNVMDENFFYAPNINERYKEMDELFHTREIERASDIIKKYKIKYIWIDGAMRNGQVWNEDDEGLLFLLGASKNFKREYKNDYVEIWRFVD